MGKGRGERGKALCITIHVVLSFFHFPPFLAMTPLCLVCRYVPMFDIVGMAALGGGGGRWIGMQHVFHCKSPSPLIALEDFFLPPKNDVPSRRSKVVFGIVENLFPLPNTCFTMEVPVGGAPAFWSNGVCNWKQVLCTRRRCFTMQKNQ